VKETPYRVKGSWHQAIRGVQRARPSVLIQGVVPPAILWLLVGMFHRFSPSFLIRSGVPLPILATGAVLSGIIARRRSGRRKSHIALARYRALFNMMYTALFLVTLSGYFLLGALGLTTTSRGMLGAFPELALALYLFSAIAAALWSPQSLPRSKADDGVAFARDAKWLPWLLGMQGALVGLGVLLGTFAARFQDVWSALALGGLAALGASLCVTFGILMLYRFVFLALHSIPPEVQEEFGLKD